MMWGLIVMVIVIVRVMVILILIHADWNHTNIFRGQTKARGNITEAIFLLYSWWS